MLQYMFLCIINTLFGLYVSMYIHINLCAKHSFTDFFFFFYSFGVEFNDHISCLSLSVRSPHQRIRASHWMHVENV